jgi:glycerol-3-phosphate dehydrogenase
MDTDASGWGSWGTALAAVGYIATAAVTWWANNKVRSSQDRAQINTLDELQEENTTLRSENKQMRNESTTTNQVLTKAVGDLRMAQKDLQRMRLKMNRKGITDSEIQASIDTNLAVLDALE